MSDTLKCPKCKAPTVERTNRQSGEKFQGCSRFPECKGSVQEDRGYSIFEIADDSDLGWDSYDHAAMLE